MCDLRDGFKLCTCDEDAKSFDWELQRRDSARPLQAKRGRAVMPRFSSAQQQTQQLILDRLAAGTAFDFEFSPLPEDVLVLKLPGKVYRFRYERGGWQIDLSTSLAGWREQMVRLDRGCLG